MQKILNYITRGEGLGIKIIMLASFIVALIFSLYLRIAGADLVPLANDVINQMLPLKIENGVVVSPVNTVRIAHIETADAAFPLPLVLNTNIDALDTANAEPGIYLTRTAIYAVNDHEVRMYPYEGDFEAVPADYSDGILSALSLTAVITFFVGLLVVFVTYFIAALFYSICAQILGLILSKKNNFDSRMRLSVVCFMTVYVFYFILSFIGISSTNLAFFLTTIALQAYIIYKLPSAEAAEAIETIETVETAMAEPKEEVVVKESKTEVKAPKKKAPAKKKTAAKKETSAKRGAVEKKEPTQKKKTTGKKAAPKKKAAVTKAEK